MPTRIELRPRDIALVASVVLAAVLTFVANYYAATFYSVGSFTFALGTLTFALGYTLDDYIRRYHGRSATIVAVAAGAVGTLLYTAVFDGGLGRIVLASLTSLVIASSVDIRVQTLLLGGPIWRLVLVSNAVSLLVDTVVFSWLAFGGTAGLPLVGSVLGDLLVADPSVSLAALIRGDYVVKIVMTLVSVPLIYAVTMVVPFRPLAPARAR